jgi:opacity protein-like surface antigen
MKNIRMATIGLFLSATPVFATDIVVGIGAGEETDRSSSTTAFQFEVHSNPIREFRWGNVSTTFVAQANSDKDAFVGVGLSALSNTRNNWFIEGSFAAGYYDAGSQGTDLGGNLQFRSLIGVGYRLSESSSVSLAVDHISNAGLNDFNPGRNSISIRYRMSF